MTLSSMDLKLSTEDVFDVASQSVGCHSSNGSFSDVSSAYNPFTPTSGCSTPLRRSTSAFDASFSSYTDSASFDLTPPSSAVSTQFPYDFKAHAHQQDMFFHGLPSTPSKYNNVMLDVGLDSHHLNGQLTPPHGMNFLPFSSLHAPPFASPCHTLDGENPESAELWSQIAAETPIDFGEPQRLQSVYEPNAMHPRSHQNLSSPSYRAQFAGSRRQVHMTDAQKKAAALQNVQQKSPRLKNRARPRKAKNPSRTIPICGPVKNIPLRQFYCDQGCSGKAYSRQEHLKRHFLTAHNPEKPVIPCKFCPKDKMKIFDRADNYRQHLELHAKPGRKGRVEFHTAAAKELNLLKAQIKRRAPPKGRMRDSVKCE